MPKNTFTCDCNAVHHHLVAQALEGMPEGGFFAELAEFFKILSDPTRCKLIWALQGSELCVCDLANILSMTKSSISHQLRKMLDQGVVKSRRAGKEVYYSLNDAHVEQLFAITTTHIQECNHEK